MGWILTRPAEEHDLRMPPEWIAYLQDPSRQPPPSDGKWKCSKCWKSFDRRTTARTCYPEGIIEEPKRVQIHQSFMGVLWRCELQAMFRYLLGIRRPPRARMYVGKGVHKSVELDLAHKISTGELLPRKDAIDIGAEAYDSSFREENIELEADEKKAGKSVQQVIDENRDKVASLAGLHWDEVAPNLQPERVEFPFSINMDAWLRKRGEDLLKASDVEPDAAAAKMLVAEARVMLAAADIGTDLTGTIDIIEKFRKFQAETGIGAADGLGIRDTKTSGKPPAPGAAFTSEQLDVYSLASLIYEKKLPDAMTLDYLYQTPKKKQTKYRPMPTTRDMDDINVILFRFARAVHRWKTAEKSGDFAPANPNDWWCSEKWCGYFDRCPAAKRPKLVQIGEVKNDDNSE